jgi:hypothetical protein
MSMLVEVCLYCVDRDFSYPGITQQYNVLCLMLCLGLGGVWCVSGGVLCFFKQKMRTKHLGLKRGGEVRPVPTVVPVHYYIARSVASKSLHTS